VLKRDQWLDLARKRDWDYSYVPERDADVAAVLQQRLTVKAAGLTALDRVDVVQEG
jgi:hypothetical protein